MENKYESENPIANTKNILKMMGLAKLSDHYRKGTESIQEKSKSITNNLVKNVQDKSTEVMNNLKNLKLRNLEYLIHVDKSNLVASNKKTLIYLSSDKTDIIDKDMWGEPQTVTTKTGRNLSIKAVKYLDDVPFLYPLFNEKHIKGELVHLSENEIWYLDLNVVTILSFKGERVDTLKINLNVPKQLTRHDLLKMPELTSYIQNCSYVYNDKRLTDFLTKMKITVEDLFRANKNYLIVRTSDKEFDVLLIEDNFHLYDRIHILKLPFLNSNALDVLFSPEIVSFVQTNDYRFEDFFFTDNHLEYWKALGDKKVCLMRCKI